MATDQEIPESKKRKRSQKTRQGPSATRKKLRPDDAAGSTGDEAKEVVDDAGVPVKVAEVANGEDPYPSNEKKGRRDRRKPNPVSHQLSAQGQLRQGKKDTTASNWTLLPPVGGRYIGQDPKFTCDEKYMIAAKEHGVQLLSLKDSIIQHTIPASERSSIQAFAASLCEPSRVFIGQSNPCRVEQWNWEKPDAPTTSFPVAGTILQLQCIDNGKDPESIAALVSNDGTSQTLVLDGKSVYEHAGALQRFVVCEDVAFCVGVREILAVNSITDSPWEISWKLNYTPTTITVRKQTRFSKKCTGSAFDIALGVSTGEIFLYENVPLGSNNTKAALPTPRTLHWHREAVLSMQWSVDGRYLISGGKETVLVIWQLDTGRKQFLPHLSADIERLTVSPSGTSYALHLSDNSIMVFSTAELQPTAHFPDVQAQLPISSTWESLSVASLDKSGLLLNNLRLAGCLHPQEEHKLMMTVPSSASDTASTQSRPYLQAFSLSSERHLYRQALTRNNLTDLKSGPTYAQIQSPDTTLLALTSDGKSLATVEAWTPPSADFAFLALEGRLNAEAQQARREVYIKFWTWDETHGRWSLQSRITNPHPHADGAVGKVLELVADPNNKRFFSLGTDCAVRAWTYKAATSSWILQSQHALPTESALANVPADAPPAPAEIAALAISPDSSLIAVSLPPSHPFQTTSRITLLASEPTLSTLTDLPQVPGNIHSLAFSTRTLVALTPLSLTTFDVPTLSQTTTIRLPDLPAKPFLPTRHHHLSLSPQAAIAVALPARAPPPSQTPWTTLQIYPPSSSPSYSSSSYADRPSFSTSLPGIVMGLYAPRRAADRGRSGFVAVFADGRVVRVAPPETAVAERLGRIRGLAAGGREGLDMSGGDETGGTVEVEGGDGEVAVQGDDKGEAHARVLPDVGQQQQEEEEEVLGEKPIVRPEQLASILEDTRAQSVRDMFERVLGLYARRPVRRAAAVTVR